jgi:hypothetical protein
MTRELKEKLSSNTIPQINIVDFSEKEARQELSFLIQKKEEISKRKEVDWQHLNSFVIKR